MEKKRNEHLIWKRCFHYLARFVTIYYKFSKLLQKMFVLNFYELVTAYYYFWQFMSVL